MPGSPAAALVPAPRHTQWPRNQTSHEHAACCVGVTLHRMRVKGIRWLRLAVGRAVASARRMDVLWKCPFPDVCAPGARVRACRVSGWGRWETSARPRAAKPSRRIDQRPRRWSVWLRAASSLRRVRSQSASLPAV